VRVTHPFHPLLGQEFAFITVRLTWGRWRVQYYDEGGVVRSLPASWTSVAAVDPFVVRAAGRSILHVEDLIALTELVAGLAVGATADA
jgi:hypothetical protein